MHILFFIMKNLLLIFFLGFALFWVGCEKEEIHLPVEAASAEQASDQDKASLRSQEMPCECTSVSPVTITQNTMNQGITCLDDFVEGVSGTFEATPAIIDEGNSAVCQM